MTVAILLLAAGASSRMRAVDKLLQEVDGVPLLRRQAIAMLATGAPVLVTLPPNAPTRRKVLVGLDVTLVEVVDAAQGMSASLRAGAAAARNFKGIAVVPADMPEITTQDMTKLLNTHDGNKIVRATGADGTPGHPVIFPARLFEELMRLQGDTGARPLIKNAVLISLPDRHALVDLDTPEDWLAWKAARKTL